MLSFLATVQQGNQLRPSLPPKFSQDHTTQQWLSACWSNSPGPNCASDRLNGRYSRTEFNYRDSSSKVAGQCGVKGGINMIQEWVKEQRGKKAVVAMAGKV